MLLNAQSISHKIDERSVHVDLLRSDIIYVIETWLTDFIPDEIIQIKGYSNVRRDRTNDISGGGVSLYIRENIPFKIRTDLQHRSIECLWITIRHKWLPRNISRIAVATVYLPPSNSSTDMDEFNDYFCFCIDSLVSESTETAIVATGDFNPNSNNFRVKRFELQCGLKQTVQVPTRGDNTLDLIFTTDIS